MVNYFKRRKEILNQLDVFTTRRANYRAQGGINYVDYSGGIQYVLCWKAKFPFRDWVGILVLIAIVLIIPLSYVGIILSFPQALALFLAAACVSQIILALMSNADARKSIEETGQGEIIFFWYSQKLLGKVLTENKKLESAIHQATEEKALREDEKRKRRDKRKAERLAEAREVKHRFDLAADIVRQELGGTVNFRTEIDEQTGEEIATTAVIELLSSDLSEICTNEIGMSERGLEILLDRIALLQTVVQNRRRLTELIEDVEED